MSQDNGKISVREACRKRIPLGGADAQALEHALTITERERDSFRTESEQLKIEIEEYYGVEGRCSVGHNKRLTSTLAGQPVCVACERDAAREALCQILEALEEDDAGRGVSELMRFAANMLAQQGGGPVEDCLRSSADRIDAALAAAGPCRHRVAREETQKNMEWLKSQGANVRILIDEIDEDSSEFRVQWFVRNSAASDWMDIGVGPDLQAAVGAARAKMERESGVM